MKLQQATIIALLLVAGTAAAQQLSTEVVVDRTVESRLPGARPLPSVRPSLYTLPTTADSLTMAESTSPVDYAPTADPDGSDIYTGLAAPDDSRGYAWLGYFPAYNMTAGAGYSLISTEESMLRAAMSFRGCSYANHADEAPEGHMNQNVIGANIFGSHTRGATTLSGKARYSYTALKAPDERGVYSPQGINRAEVKLNLDHHADRHSLGLELRFAHTGVTHDIYRYVDSWSGQTASLYAQPGAKTTDAGLTFNFSTRLSKKVRFNLDIDGDYLYLMGSDRNYGYYQASRYSWGIFAVEPSFDFRFGAFGARLGMKVFGAVGDTFGRFWLPNPDVRLEFAPIKQASIYVSMDANRPLNTLDELYAYSPYTLGGRIFAPVLYGFDLRAGLRVGSLAGFSADIFGGLVYAYNYLHLAVVSPGTCAHIAVDSDGGSQIGFRLSYDFGKKVSVGVDGYVTGVDRVIADRLNLDKAKFIMEARVRVNPTSKLGLGIDYRLRTDRSFSGYGDAGDVSRLDLSAQYALTRRLSVFARLDNILNNRPLLMPMISMQGFTGMVGATYRF